MKIKSIVLIVASLGCVLMFVAMNSVNVGICDRAAHGCRNVLDTTEHIFYFFPFILFFSLVTYKLKESVFSAWWKFAQIAIPVVFLLSFIISLELHHNPGGFFNLDDSIDMVGYFIIYTVFVLGSLIQIYRGYKKPD